jgi:hypothetical protein
MPQPAWRLIVENRPIPHPQAVQWTPILDYAPPGKLLKIVVIEDPNANPPVTGKWRPKDFPADGCSADGDYENKQSKNGTPLVASAPRGALIGRLGGSTADQTLDANTAPSRILFAVGRYCVLMVPQSPAGALFLGVNDSPDRMGNVSNNLYVNIYEAL